MKEQLISLETAKLAKEKGFDIPVLYSFDYINKIISGIDLEEFSGDIFELNDNHNRGRNYSSPTQSFLQKWLREVHKIYVHPEPSFHKRKVHQFYCSIFKNSKQYDTEEYYDTYEEAFEVGLQEALGLIKIAQKR